MIPTFVTKIAGALDVVRRLLAAQRRRRGERM